MASSPLGSLPPMNPPALISLPPSPETVVGSSSQPPLSQLPPPYISPSAPPLPAPPSVAVLPPAITPAASPPLPFPTPESSPPAPPTPPPVSPEAPSLPASLPEAPPPLPALLPVAPPPLPEAPPLPASQPSPQPPPPPPDLATTPSQPEIITTPVTSPLPPQLPILSPPSPPVIPSLPLPPSPPATSTPPPSPSSQVSLPPPTLPKPFFPTPSEISLPPSPSSANQHAFTAAAPLPSAPLPSGGFRPVALPLVTSANLPPVSTRQHQLSPAGLIVGCLVGGVALFLVLALLGTIIYRRSKKTNHEPKSSDINGADLAPEAQHSKQSTPSTNSSHVINVGTQASPPLTGPTAAPGSCSFHVPPAEKYPTNGLTYEELAVATHGFSDQNLVGEGGFGYVHKGVLSNGKEVAVKQLREGRKQGEKEFQAEVEIISRIHHKHLVSLLGYCIHGAKRLLVYEFVPNDTLEFHLHGIGRPVMEWGTRLRIAVGAAKGLAYLHEDCDPKILHRDIKAANILVDHNFEAKVSDFGLARSYNADASVTHISTQVVGTFGYLAPEYASSGKVTEKSDVYSYGVVLLELITGRPPICFSESVSRTSLVEWARPLLAQAVETRNVQSLVDPRLGTSYDESEMARMVSCAAACVRHSAWLRPRMTQVVRALEGDARASMCLDRGNDLGRGYGRWKSSNYCSAQYEEDMKRFNVVLASDHSGVTGEYGLKSSSVSGRCTTSERRL